MPDPITPMRLRAACSTVARICNAATPGPWRHSIDEDEPDRLIESDAMVIIRDENCNRGRKIGRDEANYDFIATSRTLLPATLPAMRAPADLCEQRQRTYSVNRLSTPPGNSAALESCRPFVEAAERLDK